MKVRPRLRVGVYALGNVHLGERVVSMVSGKPMSTTWKMPQAPPPLPSPVPSRRKRSLIATRQPEIQRGWQRYHASGISLLVHSSLFLLLAVLGTGSVSVDGTGTWTSVVMEMRASPENDTGIYVDNVGASALGNDESAAGGASSAGQSASLPGGEAAPIDVDSVLSKMEPGGGNGGIGDVGDAAGGLGLGSGGPKLGGSASGAQGKTSVFGIEGTGSHFVYVFDRSSSMNGYGGLPMIKAKNELIKSLHSLNRVNHFQLIFYNDEPMAYGQLAGTMQLFPADDENKQMAIGYVRRMSPDGGTQHLPALRMALSMGVDVVFFLTDADQPPLTQRDLTDLADRAARRSTVIHTIQFGAGGNQGSGAWIAELARSTGGKYRYIDVSTFASDSGN